MPVRKLISSDSGSSEERTSLIDKLQDTTFEGYSSTTSRRSSLAAVPVTLTWENVNVVVPARRGCSSWLQKDRTEAKTVLNDVRGAVEAGQLLALMGASGAGKTTLLNVLTGRNVKGLDVAGDIRVNGAELSRRQMTRVSAYVQQHDIFIGALTVREHLIFQATLRLPSSKYTQKQKVERADDILAEMGLAKVINSKIGIRGMIRGISGGEAKRLAFASEALNNPSLFFCDEPTTGLDSYMAEQVVAQLYRMAARGRTIICTIHQPPSEVFAMFNNILLMSEGRTAFCGSSYEALKFFESAGYPCPEGFNPADFFIENLAIVPATKDDCLRRVSEIADFYDQSPHAKKIDSVIDQANLRRSQSIADFTDQIHDGYAVGKFTQTWLLFWRAHLFNMRNYRIYRVRLLQKLIMGVFIGLLYFQVPLTQTAIIDLRGAMFFMLMQVSVPAMMVTLRNLPQDFELICREYHSGLYSVSSYYIGKIASYVPLFVSDATVFYTISYWMVGFRPTAGAFFLSLLTGILIEQCSVGFGTFISAVTPSLEVGLMVIGPTSLLLQMLAGLYANVQSLPVYLSWVQYISWYRYAFETMNIVQWAGVEDIPCGAANETATGCLPDGTAVLASLGFAAEFLARDILAITGIMFFFYFTAGWFLAFRVHRNG